MTKRLMNPNCQYSILGSTIVCQMNDAFIRTGLSPYYWTMELIDWAHEQRDYCLDAPDLIPGGSCFSQISDCWPMAGRSDSTHQTAIKRDGDSNRCDHVRKDDFYLDPSREPEWMKNK